VLMTQFVRQSALNKLSFDCGWLVQQSM